MGLADKWWEIEQTLPPGWKEARLVLIAEGNTFAARATTLLGPANPGRNGYRVSFYTAQHGAGVGPKAVGRLLARLDEEGVKGTLELVSANVPEATTEAQRQSLVAAWDELVADLPEDWSDLYAELDLDSSDYLQPGALAVAPLNPARHPDSNGFRFRVARLFGYGTSPQMTRRCFERLDEQGITGSVQILRALSDTKPVGTQGPVWYVGGRSV